MTILSLRQLYWRLVNNNKRTNLTLNLNDWPGSVGLRSYLYDLAFYLGPLVFYLLDLVFVVVDKDLFEKRSLVFVFKRLLVLPEPILFLFSFLSPLVPVDELFYFLVKPDLLLLWDHSTHFVPFVFVEQNWLQILSVRGFILTTKIMLVLLYLLVEVSKISQLWYFFLIYVVRPYVSILVFNLLNFVLLRRDS